MRLHGKNLKPHRNAAYQLHVVTRDTAQPRRWPGPTSMTGRRRRPLPGRRQSYGCHLRWLSCKAASASLQVKKAGSGEPQMTWTDDQVWFVFTDLVYLHSGRTQTSAFLSRPETNIRYKRSETRKRLKSAFGLNWCWAETGDGSVSSSYQVSFWRGLVSVFLSPFLLEHF